MRFFLAFLALAPLGCAQVCAPPERLQPVDAVSGAIAETSCRLTDGSGYAEYALLLPRRGRLELDAESAAFPASVAVRDAAGHAVAKGASIRAAMEAGAYTVAVATATPGQAGDFHLRANFIPEPGAMCREDAPIGLIDSVAGRLSDASCRTPDGSRYDAFRLNALGDGSLDLSVESTDLRPALILRGDDGRALATSEEGRLTTDISGDQFYTIVVYSSDAGAYRLKVNFTPGEAANCRPVKTLTASDQDSGQITSKACAYTDPATGDKFSYNWYELNVSEFGMVELRASADNFGPALELVAPDGSTIASDFWAAGTAGQALIRYQLRPGRYSVLLYSDIPAGGAYTLQYILRPGLVNCPLLPLADGGQLTGTLSGNSSCRALEGIADVYQITTPGPGTLEIGMASNDFDTYLVLRDSSDSRIVANDDSNGSTNSYIAADLPAGTYSVVATALDAPGGYGVAYRFTPHDLAACATVPQLDAGYNGVLSTSSCRAANGQAADIYQFTTPSDGTVALTMSSQYMDSFLELSDAQGNVLRRDDNTLGQGDALITQFLPAGTYRVTARDAESAVLPSYYQLLRYYGPGDRPAGCAPLRSVASGDSLTGRLDLTACDYRDGTFADFYQIDVADPAQFQITVDSSDFDAYVLVLDGKGNTLGEDDDSGGQGNAALIQNLGPGTYTIVVKSATGYTGGAYKLGVAIRQ